MKFGVIRQRRRSRLMPAAPALSLTEHTCGEVYRLTTVSLNYKKRTTMVIMVAMVTRMRLLGLRWSTIPSPTCMLSAIRVQLLPNMLITITTSTSMALGLAFMTVPILVPALDTTTSTSQVSKCRQLIGKLEEIRHRATRTRLAVGRTKLLKQPMGARKTRKADTKPCC
mmetsp:Transcript_30354/g.73990  ORF Transcript_30354/g.73990 Transcript_30354/m.73990 type:complete len:169 (+) Transcript_30354:334-840(+)